MKLFNKISLLIVCFCTLLTGTLLLTSNLGGGGGF